MTTINLRESRSRFSSWKIVSVDYEEANVGTFLTLYNRTITVQLMSSIPDEETRRCSKP